MLTSLCLPPLRLPLLLVAPPAPVAHEDDLDENEQPDDSPHDSEDYYPKSPAYDPVEPQWSPRSKGRKSSRSRSPVSRFKLNKQKERSRSRSPRRHGKSLPLTLSLSLSLSSTLSHSVVVSVCVCGWGVATGFSGALSNVIEAYHNKQVAELANLKKLDKKE